MMAFYKYVVLLQIVIAAICGTFAVSLFDMAKTAIVQEAYQRGQFDMLVSLPISALGEVKVKDKNI